MNAYDDKNQNPENTHEAEEASVPAESGTEIAELSNEAMDGLIAEIASEEVKENKNNPSGQKQGAAQATQKKEDSTQEDRLALRERLLKTAPREAVMREEVVRELEKKKVQLESDIKTYQRRKEYHLLSAAVAQLRAVLRQIEIVAKAGFDALKEIWLKVVHKFA